MSTPFPNTETKVDRGQINTGLSTQIIIKVNNVPVGALQRLTVNQARPLERIKEIGTDGIIEIVPNGPTTFELTADRVVFDQLRLPEAFSRGFRFINAQRLPFDIEVFDLSGISPTSDSVAGDMDGIVVVTYKNCWFSAYSTPYASDNYIVTETSTIACETAFLTMPNDSKLDAGYNIPNAGGLRGIKGITDNADIERQVNLGGRRGAMDAGGIISSVFK